ncbi:uncharacterized protein BDZ99DRAFT_151656 [Mytilinidion resinicola]|uniref:Zn(2)-C6 fungal-type domain-containing protein n=1 Tax=Mytilinidion resinicola TaxID=574789 RepID=A0A6A6Y802_9PEZI|nr:uncharacterized protein BDZ99DRAFT_151656 [Mytilinidion resinicola]KAF2804739.1 hypothetical protein BDZ99DRAFT_151656 [Mytilinidion resinicola]
MTTPDADDASPSPEYSGDQDGADMADQNDLRASSEASPNTTPSIMSKANAKDPLRPRRKKARRACFACQRAHLTCGDERPCSRCVKRGLQDACQDGVRKKAKYLHDTPNEALMPGVGGHYPHINGNQTSTTGQVSLPDTPVSAQRGTFFAQPQPGNFNMYQQPPQHGQLPQHIPEGPPIGSFNGQQTPISPTFGQNPQQSPPIQTIPNSQVSQANASQMHNFGGPLFDPSDPALFNFDIASLNFGNHYGALEFGMLGHMSSGAADTPPSDNNLMNPLNQAANMYGPQMSGGYAENAAASVMAPGALPYQTDGLSNSDWQNSQSRHNSIAQIQTPHNTPMSANLDNIQRHDSTTGLPHAYAIGQGPSSLSTSSPASNAADLGSNFDNGPMSPATFFVNPNGAQRPSHQNYTRQQIQQAQQHQQPHQQPAQSPSQSRQSVALQPIQSNAMTRKRRRDTNYIYEGIKKPYPYSMSFHRVMGDVATRISKDKQARIGKAMATFRPSFVACSKELDENDLIFSEKNLQRQLLTLEDSIDHLGTPTLVLRRTGEVVALGKEFTILTGWPREVLLGKNPNLNVNWGNSPNASGSSTRMTRSPYILPGKNPDDEDNGPRPVSIVELMDEDSVVQFYEDYATMAFEDSRGSKSRCVNFLKYRTKEDMMRFEELAKHDEKNGNGNGHSGGGKGETVVKTENAIHNEAGMYKLGQKEGMVKCMCVWHIRRDNFDMPMLIVMNILPWI